MGDVSNLAKLSKTNRSRIANGSTLHSGEVDGRSVEARRFRDIVAEISSDLGGSETLSEAQKQLIRRAALLSVQGEKMEAEAVSGGEIDIDTYGALTDRLGRCFNRLGLRRVAREVGPQSMIEYAAMLKAKREAAE